MDKKSFGLNLAKVRVSKNISAYELSLRIGKTSNYIHKVETAKIEVGISTIFEICSALEIDPRDLFTCESA